MTQRGPMTPRLLTTMRRERIDSRTGYLPHIDLPPEFIAQGIPPAPVDIQTCRGLYRPEPPSPAVPPATARANHRRAEFWRVGNQLTGWRVGDLKKYKCNLPVGGGCMPHPGLVLPEALSTSQGLFGPSPNKTGTPRTLRSVALSMPRDSPRFMTHDSSSMSASMNGLFRKTAISFNPDHSSSKDMCSEYTDRFPYPPSDPLRTTNLGSCGAPTSVYGRSGVALISGSGKAGMSY